MHGTGTALGDPIELAAASAVLLHSLPASHAPLGLGAAKSSVGHAETSSGLVGMASLLEQGLAGAAAALLHLRQLNPHVASVQQSARAAGCAAAVPPRQAVAAPRVGSPAACAGVSSFAFQGTNAHTILQAGAQPRASAASRARAWERHRHWCSPPPHALLGEAVAGAGRGSFTVLARLGGAGLAYLWDHRVAGCALFPGAGFFELASAAARTAGGAHALASCVLAQVSIAAPLELPDLSLAAATNTGGIRPSGVPVTCWFSAGSVPRKSVSAQGGLPCA
jgi:acyl transferase domain-containing protein